MRKLHLIPTFHHDIAYLRPESWYTETAVRILDRALAIMEENEEYTFTVEQAYFFDEYWRTHPEKQESMKKFAQNGQLNFAPGFFAVPDMSMPSGESLYMQAYYGKKILAETVGYEPKTAFIADCWGHCSALPQIMKQCGYTGYTFSRCMERSFDIENFRWCGIDGSEIDTHWMSTAYAGLSFPDGERVNAEELHWENATADGVKSLVTRNAAHCGEEADQIIPVGGDMRMPSTAAPSIVRELNKRDDLPELEFSSFEKAFDSIDFASAPVYEGEFISSLKGTFATNIQIKQANRRLEGLIGALEAVSSLTGKDADFTEPWKTTLKNQFHDIICGTICDESLVQVMDEYAQAENILREIEKDLADGCDVPFNALNFPVSGLTADGKTYKAGAFAHAEFTQLEKNAVSLPCTYENEYWKAEIDARGFITRLTDKNTGADLVNNPRIPFGSLQLQADSGDNWVEFEYPWEEEATLYTTNVPDPYDRRKLPTHPKVQLAANGVIRAEAESLGEDGLIVKQQGHLSYWITDVPFEVTVIFSNNTPRIEYKVKFQNKTKRVRLRAAFETAERGKVRYHVPYGIAERNEGAQPAGYFIDVASDRGGLALINRGLPANNCEDGIMMLTLFRSVAMEYKCQSELSYNTGSEYEVGFAILPHGADADDLITENALLFNTPFVLAPSEAETSGWSVDGAYISAMRKTEDGVFLRVYGGTKKEKTARITLPAGFCEYAYADGIMRAGEWQKTDGVLEVNLGAFEVKGIMIR